MIGIQGVLLFSGGLDSILAAKVLMNQGVSLIGFHCVLPFEKPGSNLASSEISRLADQIGLSLEFYRCDDEYLSEIINPRHGYGKKMNPCIDCKIFFIRKAFDVMMHLNAEFVATGEVVGQRPMSQMKHMLNHIEKETVSKGRLLRPLSAKLLKPTIAEEKGIVDRNGLYDFSGRGRRRQMELANQLGIMNYRSPAGGCLLTDPAIARRVEDLFLYDRHPAPVNMYVLTIGRHFRINPTMKLIVGRNERENNELEFYKSSFSMVAIPDFNGPTIALQGSFDEGVNVYLVSLMRLYSKRYTDYDTITLHTGDGMVRIPLTGPCIDTKKLKEYLL